MNFYFLALTKNSLVILRVTGESQTPHCKNFILVLDILNFSLCELLVYYSYFAAFKTKFHWWEVLMVHNSFVCEYYLV